MSFQSLLAARSISPHPWDMGQDFIRRSGASPAKSSVTFQNLQKTYLDRKCFSFFPAPTRNPLEDILGIRPSSQTSTCRTTSPTQLHGASACTQNTRHPQTNIYELSQSIFATLLPASKDAMSPGVSLHRVIITSRLRPRRTQGTLARPLTTHTHTHTATYPPHMLF